MDAAVFSQVVWASGGGLQDAAFKLPYVEQLWDDCYTVAAASGKSACSPTGGDFCPASKPDAGDSPSSSMHSCALILSYQYEQAVAAAHQRLAAGSCDGRMASLSAHAVPAAPAAACGTLEPSYELQAAAQRSSFFDDLLADDFLQSGFVSKHGTPAGGGSCSVGPAWSADDDTAAALCGAAVGTQVLTAGAGSNSGTVMQQQVMLAAVEAAAPAAGTAGGHVAAAAGTAAAPASTRAVPAAGSRRRERTATPTSRSKRRAAGGRSGGASSRHTNKTAAASNEEPDDDPDYAASSGTDSGDEEDAPPVRASPALASSSRHSNKPAAAAPAANRAVQYQRARAQRQRKQMDDLKEQVAALTAAKAASQDRIQLLIDSHASLVSQVKDLTLRWQETMTANEELRRLNNEARQQLMHLQQRITGAAC